MKKPTRPTRILMVLYYYEPYVSGVSVCAKRVAEGLVRRGYDVTVLTSRFDKKLPKREMISGVEVIRRPVAARLGKGVIMPMYWLDIVRYARRYDYVNPHLPMTDSGLSSLFIPKRKQVTTYQCDLFLGNGLAARLITFVSMQLMRLQLKRSRVVVPSSRDYLAHSKMREFLNKAQPIYPPVTTGDFKRVDAAPLLKRLSVPAGTVTIGFLGRVVYEKGIGFLLQAIPELQKKFKDFKIIIAGDYEKVAGGSVKEELDRFIKLYPGNIIFTGYLDDADRNRFYSAIDVFVLPSIDPLEAFGMVQIEAMLCGAPVVASDLPGVRQIIKHTGYGLISRPKDPRDIAAKIIEVVSNPKKYKPERTRVAKIFDAEASIEAYAAAMPAVYHKTNL